MSLVETHFLKFNSHFRVLQVGGVEFVFHLLQLVLDISLNLLLLLDLIVQLQNALVLRNQK